MAELTFEAPGPGTWQLNDLHFPRPLTRYKRDLPSPIASDRSRRGLAKYGLIVDFDVEYVNGFQYISRQPVDGTPGPESDPATIEDIPTKPENEFQRRVHNAKETFDTNRWRTDLERWDTEWKPTIEETNRSLQSVAPAELNNDELIRHLEDCRGAVIEHGSLVFRILPCAFVPQGDFLAFVQKHTDRSPDEVVPLFAGASPDSQGAIDELDTLVGAVEAVPDAKELVFSDESPEDIIDHLREFGEGVGDAVDDWLTVVGYRTVSGFDLDGQYALERPRTLVSTLRTAIKENLETGSNPDVSEELEAIRQAVSPERQETFDERYEEMRLTYRVQDERYLRYSTTEGLLRRALLEAGRRLSERGLLRNREHVVDMEHGEIIAALRGESAPQAAEVAVHVRYRETHNASDAPDQLGSDESPAIEPDSLPEPAARVMNGFAARQWANESEFGPEEPGADVITGHGVTHATAEGSARIVDGPEDFDRIQDGDILVTEITNPAFNVVLPMLGGVVTDTGGMLSHPAIVAREFGIPGVVGCEDATDRIQDGDELIVDGAEGTVRFAN